MMHLQKALANFKPVVIKQTVNETGNLEIIQEFTDPNKFVNISGNNEITFKIQDGVISENGINGIQASDLIEYTLELIKSLNNEFPCRENSLTITKLEESLFFQKARTIERIKRNVEGKNLV